MKVEVSVPGKLHLIGEHAVVYGAPAILAAIDLKLKLSCKWSADVEYHGTYWNRNDEVMRYSLNEMHVATEKLERLWAEGDTSGNFLPLFEYGRAENFRGYRLGLIGLVLKELGRTEGVTLEMSGELPIGSGLGSSAAFAVALVGAISNLAGAEWTLEEINTLSFRLEQMIHGRPSGGDNTTCAQGGFIWFEKGREGPTFEVLSPLKPEIASKFFLIETREKKRSTGEMVQRVCELDQTFRDQRIGELRGLAGEMRGALANSDLRAIQKIIARTQYLLAELRVSTEEIEEIVRAVEKEGGAAKLCGAGGGGAVLLVHDDPESIQRRFGALKYVPRPIELGATGLRIEEPVG